MRRFLATCSVVLLAIALFGACGGSSSKPAASSLTTKDGSSGPSDALTKLYGNAANARFKITFKNEGGDETTYAQDGNGKSSFTSGDSQFFTSSSGSVQCNKGSDGKATCSSYPGGASANPFLGIYNLGRTYVDALGKYGDSSSKSIAGRKATCVKFSKDSVGKAGVAGAAIAAAIKGSLVYCVDKETGVLLSLESTDENGKTTSSFTVTKFGEPSESDFTPPATPSSVSIPDVSIPTITYPPGYTGPTIPGNG